MICLKSNTLLSHFAPLGSLVRGNAWAMYLSQVGFVADLDIRGQQECFTENNCQILSPSNGR